MEEKRLTKEEMDKKVERIEELVKELQEDEAELGFIEDNVIAFMKINDLKEIDTGDYSITLDE